MYALIYDEFDSAKREKKVISVHKTRETAEKALEKRQRKLGKRVWIPGSFGCAAGFTKEKKSHPTFLTHGLRVKKFLKEIEFWMGIKRGYSCYPKLSL
jgi:hypothetical protein